MPVTIDYDSSWGYSTAHLFAIRSNLGGYSGLKRFVKAAHSQGLEVFMDVVYNHASAKTHLFGIDRCEFDRESKTHLQPTFCPSNGFKKKIPCAFGSYFYMDENQLTPWGPRYNFSSEQVRDFLMSNVKYWVEELGIDGLRFDSTICIRKTQGTNAECWQPDATDNPDGIKFLRESTQYLSMMNCFSIAEDLERDPIITDSSGIGFDAKWDNSLFHQFHSVMKNKDGETVKALMEEVIYRCSADSGSFISYTESHDIASSQAQGHARSARIVQNSVGNKELLDRAKILPITLALLSCGTPMIFQGQEIGETETFSYPYPPKFDWDELNSVEWIERNEDVIEPVCHTDAKDNVSRNKKVEIYTNIATLVRIFSSLASSFDVNQDGVPSTAFQFLRKDLDEKVIVGILNFDELSFELANFRVPSPGKWSVIFGLEDNEDATRTFNTITIDGDHFLQALKIPGKSTYLLQLSIKKDLVQEPVRKCAPNFLNDIKNHHLKYFDQTYWRNHMLEDLFPFWNSTDALGGDNYGNFPTFRCNDGTAYEKVTNPCEEINSAPTWIKNYTDFDIAVQHSRQIYFYSVGFHMTGSSEMLRHAKAGINVFFKKFANYESGAICTYVSKIDNCCLPLENFRTSMEHANALIGLAMYYYVSRDEVVGKFIYKSVDYAFERWFSDDLYMMRMADGTSVWPEPSVPVLEGEPLEKRKDMLAQLDQLNAYQMILRGLPNDSLKWKKQMLDLALALKESFWDEKYNIMWGNANYKELDSVHSDFGHSQKSLWFIMMVAEHVEDLELFKWAYIRAMRMISLAWLPRRLYHNATTGEIGTWAFDRSKEGISRSGHVWWVFAELTQTAAFMSISNPSIASTVSSKAYEAYMNLFIDYDAPQKGVFHWKDYKTHDTLFAKGHVWKNGFHEVEHALIASISSAALKSDEIKLFFAPKRLLSERTKDRSQIENTTFYPGFFKGDLVKKSVVTDDYNMPPDHIKTAVSWKDLRNTDHHPDPACLGVSCSGNGVCFEGECLCLHGWRGPKCDIDPCKDYVNIVPSEKYCGHCRVTFKFNPSTVYPHAISTVKIAGSFSNWSAIEMNLVEYEDVENSKYSDLFPENLFYHGISSSCVYSVDLEIPHGQNHTYKFMLDEALWTFDRCNPDAEYDGMETMDLNSIFDVSCPRDAENNACRFENKEQIEEVSEVVSNGTAQDQRMDNIANSGSVIQLFEWTFHSVAQECEKLGEEGWEAVQLSPVNAHLVLAPDVMESFDIGELSQPPIYPWWQRYQTASYEINSRSGTEAELRALTMECARHGVQIWVEVGMNSMNAAPCCDVPGPLDDYPTCDGFFSDGSKSCAPKRTFPSAGFDAGDLHSPPCGIEEIGTWGSPDVTWNCDVTGMPDLDTSSEHVQHILARYIDRLLDIGVSGFRLLTAGHIDPTEIQSIFERSVNRIREDIFQMTKARSQSPVLIVDLWPSWLIRYPHLQPDFYPDSMTPFRYTEISDNTYATDIAFSFVTADTFYRKESSLSLERLTELSTRTRFSHPMYKQKSDRISLEKLILQITNHFLTFYGVSQCSGNVNGTKDVNGVFHENVCPEILSDIWNQRLLSLGTVWMMTLPVGYTRVFSSYDWQRSYKMNEYGKPLDEFYSAGPPRKFDGGTLESICGYFVEDDVSPAFIDDGTRWICEHREQDIASMPRWRSEVAQATAYQLKINECLGTDIKNDYFVSISRSMRQGRNGPLRGGWVAINADPNNTVEKKFSTRLPAGRYRNEAVQSEILTVDSRGILQAKLEPFESIIIHTADVILEDNVSVLFLIVLFALWLLIPMSGILATLKRFDKDKDIVVKEKADTALNENGEVLSFPQMTSEVKEEVVPNKLRRTSAMICTLEHIVPETAISKKINQKVGGLGKVMELIGQFHPGPLVMVTPMMGCESYPAFREAESITCMVDGKEEIVQVFHHCWPGMNGQVESIFCKNDNIFGRRLDKDAELYPSDEKDVEYFMKFFTLWSQTVANLVIRHRTQLDVLHLCDYHTAFAPHYIRAYGSSIPTLCTLHNASYQGYIMKQILETNPANRISDITGLSEREVTSKFTHDGDFNMLSGLISYFEEEQNGQGFCAVSTQYAKEVPLLLDNFRVGNVHVRSLPNPELKSNRPKSLHQLKSTGELRLIKKQKKRELQQALGLRVDPDAMIAVFVGRLVIQKGIDAIADTATDMLLKHEKLQLIVVGPIGDIFGRYASARLTNLSQNKMFENRIFFQPKFFKFHSDFRLGCDFVLMPSRHEPFGFVDIEFAWAGCPVVGSLVGGLGKVPGWYFKLWQGGEFKHLRTQLSRTIDEVMASGHEKVLQLGTEAIHTSFPVINWQKKLSELYQLVIDNHNPQFSESRNQIIGTQNEYADLWKMSPNSSDLFLVKSENYTSTIKNMKTEYPDMGPNEKHHPGKTEAEECLFSLEDDRRKQENHVLHLMKEDWGEQNFSETVEEVGNNENQDSVSKLTTNTNESESFEHNFSETGVDMTKKEVENNENQDSVSKLPSTSGESESSMSHIITTEDILAHAGDLESGKRKISFEDGLNKKLETDIIRKLLTGKKTNIQTVFKYTVWAQQTVDVDSSHNISATYGIARKRLVRTCESMLRKNIAGRSMESWIIALLSIIMPNHSSLLYAQSISWATAHGWDDNQVGGIYAAHFVAYAVACIMWAQILQHFSAGICISISSLFHMISILYFTHDVSKSCYFAAVMIAAVTGLVSSANVPVFNMVMFFDELDGSLASKMKNFGFIEGSRTVFSGIFQGIIIYDLLTEAPHGGEARDSVSLQSSSSLLKAYVILNIFTIIGSSLLFLGMKKKTRTAILPKVNLKTVRSYKTFSLLSLSSILEGIISYPTLFVVSWLLMRGYNPEETGKWVIISSGMIGFSLFIFSIFFVKLHDAPKIIGVLSTHFPNPILLQAMVMMTAPGLSADTVLILLLLTLFLIKLKGGLIGVMKLHVLQSRWKFITFTCYELFFTNLASAASPFVVRSLAEKMNLSLNTVGPGSSAEASATAIFYVTLPIVVFSFILQIMANRYAFLDISDIYTKIDWTASNKKKD